MAQSRPRNRWAWACAAGLLLARSSATRAADDPLALPPPPVPRTNSAAIVPLPPPPEVKPPPPTILDRPLESPLETPPPPLPAGHGEGALLQTPVEAPQGFSGKSSVLPREAQHDDHFAPVEDRWRLGYPEWQRGEKPVKAWEDSPYMLGHWWDPYNLNVIKGDYPICGQHTFLNVTAALRSIVEPRQVPTPQNNFESTSRPGGSSVFGNPNQFFTTNFASVSFDLSHGDAAFKPADWRIRLTPIANANYIYLEENGVVSPDVRNGKTRGRDWLMLEEWFLETKLADIGPDYDFVSLRGGSQFFSSDFRGFLFSDTNRAVRLFGTRLANRDQFNVVAFFQLEKDTNSMLNTFADRDQTVFIANYYRQDFLFPGYTQQVSVHYNSDRPSFHFDRNGFLVRPDPTGVFQTHGVDVVYLGVAGDGHIGRINITHQFYWAVGRDSLNPIANQGQDINAQMFAVETSYDRDWMRFRGQFFWASGDENPNNGQACGFDTILDNPNFAGGEFSYWQRQAIPLNGVNLVQRNSLVPDLRSSKIQGQSNFVNPGLFIVGAGFDMDLTPKLKLITNYNYLWFDQTDVLETFVFQSSIDRAIGADLSAGLEYRPLLNNNVLFVFGVSTLIPGRGFKDLYNNLNNPVDPLGAAFLETQLLY